jgi:hypothetical protein
MKPLLLLGLAAATLVANEITTTQDRQLERRVDASRPDAEQDAAQPKLLRIAGMIDGSSRFIFTRDTIVRGFPRRVHAKGAARRHAQADARGHF